MNPPAPFIVGVGRSGTTLLRLMLDAHPDLAIPSETLFLQKLAGQTVGSKAQFLEIVTGFETWPNLAMDANELARAIDEPFSLADAVRSFFRLYARKHGKPRWGDKTPYYRVYMREIAALLPEAHFLHVIRDGRDSALSYRGLWFGPGDGIEDQARFWMEAIRDAREQAAELAHYSEIRYEALVAEPEAALRAICAGLGLRYDPGMLAYHETAERRLAEFKQPFGPKDRTPKDLETFMAIHDRTRKPPDTGRIGRWRTEMSREELERYEAVAGSLLRELGYETLTASSR